MTPPPPPVTVEMTITPSIFELHDPQMMLVEIALTITNEANSPVTIFTEQTIFNLQLAQRREHFRCKNLTTGEYLRVGYISCLLRDQYSRVVGHHYERYFHTLEPHVPLTFRDRFDLSVRRLRPRETIVRDTAASVSAGSHVVEDGVPDCRRSSRSSIASNEPEFEVYVSRGPIRLDSDFDSDSDTNLGNPVSRERARPSDNESDDDVAARNRDVVAGATGGSAADMDDDSAASKVPMSDADTEAEDLDDGYFIDYYSDRPRFLTAGAAYRFSVRPGERIMDWAWGRKEDILISADEAGPEPIQEDPWFDEDRPGIIVDQVQPVSFTVRASSQDE